MSENTRTPSEIAAFRDLLDHFRDGDKVAAAEIIDTHYVKVRNLVRHVLRSSVQNLYDPEDMAQDVFLAFLRCRAELPPDLAPEALVAWLLAITRRRIGRIHRGAFRGKHLTEAGHHLLPDETADDTPGFVAKGPPPDAIAVIDDLFAMLIAENPGQARLIELFRNGSTIKEVASELSITERQVRRQVQSLHDRYADD